MKKLVFILTLLPLTIFAQNFGNGYNFYLPPFDSTAQTYLPEFEINPIQGFVSVRPDGHFYAAGKPIRFWGFNMTSAGCFPNKEHTVGIAARMRKMGVNIVRFHQMDNSWSSQQGTIFDRSTNGTRALHPETLDKFHYFIHNLKRNGIYANINLHVSRRFREADGIADANDLFGGGKIVNMFDPQMIDLQKEYATQLLTSVNPYTGLSLVNDPIMAMLEISNENTLYGRFQNSQLTIEDDDGILLPRHDQMLDELWFDFLENKYNSTTELRSAWNEGVGTGNNINQIADGDFESGDPEAGWNLDLASSADADFTIEENDVFDGNYCGKINITKTTGTDWHIQFAQNDLSVELGKTYTISFAAKADEAKMIYAFAQQDFDPWRWYEGDGFELSTDWKEFSLDFTPFEDNNGRMRLGFTFDNNIGSFWLDNVSVTEKEKVALEDGESADTPRRLRYYELGNFSEGRTADLTEFYIKVQKDYFDEMYRFLKEELNVKIPISGTNAHPSVADVYTNSDLDFIDDHIYWDHVRYNNGWSLSDWNIRNESLVEDWDLEAISKIFGGYHIKGKPFTISELGHGFPNRYQTELMPLVAAYGSYHDVDAVMFFQYNESEWDWESDHIGGWWSMHRNTAQMVLSPVLSYAYRNNLIRTEERSIDFKYNKNYLHTMSRFDNTGRWWSYSPYERRLALQSDIRISTFDDSGELNFNDLPDVNDGPVISTGNFETTFQAEENFVTTVTPKLISVTGKLNSSFVIQAGNLEVTGANDFGTVAWLSLTDEPLETSRRSTLVLSSKIQNSNMEWTDNDTNVENDFGEAPTEMFPLVTSLLLKIQADSIHLKTLSPTGAVSNTRTLMPIDQGIFLVGIDQAISQSPWYGIEAFGDAISSTQNLTQAIDLKISPNPSSSKTLITSNLSTSSNIKITLTDSNGKLVYETIENNQPAGNYRKWVNLEGISSGLYFLKFQAEDMFQVKKLVVE